MSGATGKWAALPPQAMGTKSSTERVAEPDPRQATAQTDYIQSLMGGILGLVNRGAGALATPDTDGMVHVGGRSIGPFPGEWEGKPRAATIAVRLTEAGDLNGAEARAGEDGRWSVAFGNGAEFKVNEADAAAAGHASARLAAYEFASVLSGHPVPKEVRAGKQTAGRLSVTEGSAAMAYRANQVQASGATIHAYGVELGPFSDAGRATHLAERLGEVDSTDFRGAHANGAEVQVAEITIEVTAADAEAQGVATSAEGATQLAGQLDGTWVKGRHDKAGRRVMPAQMSQAVLYELFRTIAEGPGHTSVNTDPGQVTVVGLRGVNREGIYNPELGAADDIVVPLVTDRSGRRFALRFAGTVDPGGSAGGATQVGDAAQQFSYSNRSGNQNLKGTTLLRPDGEGIEGRDLNRGLQSYDEVTTQAKPRGATLIHLGTRASQSRGCTVVLDQGSYSTNKAVLTRLYNTGLEKLPQATREADAPQIKALLAAERAKEQPDATTLNRMEALLELRVLEDGMQARDAGNAEGLQRSRESLGGPEATGPIEDYATAANYKAFMSMVFRDPEMKVTYVIVDGSKVASFGSG